MSHLGHFVRIKNRDDSEACSKFVSTKFRHTRTAQMSNAHDNKNNIHTGI